MTKNEVQLRSGAKLTWDRYGDPEIQVYDDVYLEYEERQGDPWYGTPITYVDIDRQKALEIVGFLTKAFNL